MPQIVEIELRRHQAEVWEQKKRFGVLLAHRRFGKTVLAVALMIKAALLCPHRRPQAHYFCPTYGQAKKVAWQYLKDATEAFRGTIYNESELKAVLPGGAVLQLGSADNPHASRGIYSDFVVLDEPAQMPPSMWTEVLRPALSDRRGGALFIGTPHGRHGLFYEAWCDAEADGDWWRACYKASETGIIAPDELMSAQRAMSVAEYQQEYECSWDAAIKGAYWAAEMQRADAAGRITQVIHRPALPVHISMDLGINDATACWFFQLDGDVINLVDYAEYTNMGLPDIVRDWRVRPYLYGKVIMPHDGAQRSLSTGQTRQETMRQLGCDAIICNKHDVIDGIERVRLDMNRMRFDKTRCKDGIEALRQYRSDWEDQRGVLRLKPLHDWTSHGADAMRYLCMAGTDALLGGWGELDYTRQDAHRCV